VVVCDARAAGEAVAALPGGHVFAGVRGLKQLPGVAVYVVVDDGDATGHGLAPFCLADGVLVWHGADDRLDLGPLERGGRAGTQRRRSVDELLERVEAAVGAQTPQDSALQRLLRFERDDGLLHRLQDPETGLFDG